MWREKENGTATVHIPAERLALRFVGGGFMANPCTPDINDGRNKEEGKINGSSMSTEINSGRRCTVFQVEM